jgi:membrane protein YdbS with pleckstrin-like domain
MSSLPTWAVWGVIVPLVLLSPVIALLLALATDAVVCEIVDAGAPAGASLAAVASLLILWRKVRLRGHRVAPGKRATWSESL